MLALPHVLQFFAYEFSSLRGSGFPFPLILAGSLERFLFWHDSSFTSRKVKRIKTSLETFAGRRRR